MTPTTPLIDVVDVTRRYGNFLAVDRLNLQVREGEFVSLLGPSGCGKTTTLRMIAGLDQPTNGDILLRGRRINDTPVHQRQFGVVFQNLALFPHKTAFENIAFGLRQRRLPATQIRERVRAALDMVQLAHREDRYPAQLSGGQQQRIAVARAIVIEPELLLFDEPFSALDAALREELRIEVKRIQQTLGITTLFVTHDQSEALALSDQVVLMRAGAIEQQGTPDELFNQPVSGFAARFFGHVSEFTARWQAVDGDATWCELGPDVRVRVAQPIAADRPRQMLLRAERARIAAHWDASSHATILHGTVVRADYLGMLVRYEVAVAGLPFTVLQPQDGPLLTPRAPIQLRIPENAWLAA